MRDDALKCGQLAEVADVAAGYPLRVSAEELDPGDVSFVQLKNVSLERSIAWDEVPKVTLPSERGPQWLSERDVIFSARGARMLAYPVLATPGAAVCAPQFFVLSIKDRARLLPEFLAWQINQKPAQTYFQREATGSSIQSLRRTALEKLPVALPPLSQQSLIIDFWRAARREREILSRLIEATDVQLEAIATRLATHADPEGM